jgi:hydroxymethylbilane synthase
MTINVLRIISRESPLAMWQAEFVRDQLTTQHPGLEVIIIGITTQADKFLNQSLASMGGKGAFVKELEQSLLNGDADLAVHSMKDVPIELPGGLCLPVIMLRGDVSDAFVSIQFNALNMLPTGAVVGTSSLRRQCQLKALRPDVVIKDIRGNVGTRLKKLDNGEFDALILASAGLIRLGLGERINHSIPHEIIIPAVGQGALGIEIRDNDEAVLKLVSVLNDVDTQTCLSAERAVSKRLNGGCHAPIAAYAQLSDDRLIIESMVGRLDGSEIVKKSINGNKDDAIKLGENLGDELLECGAESILSEVMDAEGQ